MLTDIKKRWISDQVYLLDRSRDDFRRELQENTTHYYHDENKVLGQFQVLKVQDNNSDADLTNDNGMQAMAVAPMINDEVDITQIVIAYAGTNFSDGKDRQTDINSVILGQNYFEKQDMPIKSQIDTALEFAAQIKSQYPNSKIETTGHSLGGYLATIVSVKNQWGSTTFNAPSAHNLLSDSEQLWATRNTHILVNYRNSADWIGNFGGDPLGISRNVSSYYDRGRLEVLGAHGLSNWQFDKEGNLIDMFGRVVADKNYKSSLDIDGDGHVDVEIGNLRPKNLLFPNVLLGGYSKSIVVDAGILNTLATNLRGRIDEDIAQMMRITKACIAKNQSIEKNFESRKNQVSESIKEVFKQTGFSSLLYDLNNSVDKIIQEKQLIDSGRQPAKLNYPFSANQTPLINQMIYSASTYDWQLHRLSSICEDLYGQITREKTYTIVSLFNGEQTLLGSWQMIENTTQHLLNKSDQIFEGEGFRVGKTDGITQSLKSVLAIIEANTLELQQSLLSAVAFITGIATNFKQADEWLGTQLSQGEFIGEVPAPIVPQNYIAYLERDKVFDDVKDVLQAFDRQVEVKSREYAREVANYYTTDMDQFRQGLNQWYTLGKNLESCLNMITKTYYQSIYVRNEDTLSNDGSNSSPEYWGNLKQLYPAHVVEIIDQLDKKIVSKTDGIHEAVRRSDGIKSQVQHLEPELKSVIEKGVYTAFDLDEIVQGQKTVLQIANRLKQEIDYVAQTIVGEGMQAQAIETLQHKLQDTQRLITYYEQFVGDCFGDNENSGGSPLQSAVTRFSLNTPVAY